MIANQQPAHLKISDCKKIRNDQDKWIEVESYISEHSETQFSHSLCPDCQEKHYHDFFQDI